MTAIVKLLAGCAAALAALVVAAAPASARIVEIGQVEPAATASCPSPCIAVSRTTGYQAKVGTTERVMRVPENGRIVAWTISLGTPGERQKTFFDRGFGGAAAGGIPVPRSHARAPRSVNRLGPRPYLPPLGVFRSHLPLP